MAEHVTSTPGCGVGHRRAGRAADAGAARLRLVPHLRGGGPDVGALVRHGESQRSGAAAHPGRVRRLLPRAYPQAYRSDECPRPAPFAEIRAGRRNRACGADRRRAWRAKTPPAEGPGTMPAVPRDRGAGTGRCRRPCRFPGATTGRGGDPGPWRTMLPALLPAAPRAVTGAGGRCGQRGRRPARHPAGRDAGKPLHAGGLRSGCAGPRPLSGYARPYARGGNRRNQAEPGWSADRGPGRRLVPDLPRGRPGAGPVPALAGPAVP